MRNLAVLFAAGLLLIAAGCGADSQPTASAPDSDRTDERQSAIARHEIVAGSRQELPPPVELPVEPLEEWPHDERPPSDPFPSDSAPAETTPADSAPGETAPHDERPPGDATPADATPGDVVAPDGEPRAGTLKAPTLPPPPPPRIPAGGAAPPPDFGLGASDAIGGSKPMKAGSADGSRGRSLPTIVRHNPLRADGLRASPGSVAPPTEASPPAGATPRIVVAPGAVAAPPLRFEQAFDLSADPWADSPDGAELKSNRSDDRFAPPSRIHRKKSPPPRRSLDARPPAPAADDVAVAEPPADEPPATESPATESPATESPAEPTSSEPPTVAPEESASSAAEPAVSPGAGAPAAGASVASSAAPPTAAKPRDRLVRVYYGTDRRASDERGAGLELATGWIPGSLTGLLAIGLGFGAWRWPGRRLPLVVASGTVGSLAAMLLLRGPLAAPTGAPGASERGVAYTAERGRVSYGWCEVTIPPNHSPGEVESPSLLRLELRADAKKHVVLQRVVREEKDPFFDLVRQRVADSPRRDLFLFVHGYNVSFDDAARRTAQMAFDLEFDGAPIFFSWPSQGQLVKYTVDENNVAWSVPHLKEFLLEVVRRSEAKSVNLIAHSMGNRALASALRELEFELRQESALFNEVVLAAPDIDAEVFKRDVAPALQRIARHSTLYASSNDQALLASKVVHGYPRAGDSGDGLVLVDGVETVDVSRIDLSLLGHSYYGSSEPILDDLSQLLAESRRPEQRPWLRAAERDGRRYWVFREDAAAGRASGLRR